MNEFKWTTNPWSNSIFEETLPNKFIFFHPSSIYVRVPFFSFRHLTKKSMFVQLDICTNKHLHKRAVNATQITIYFMYSHISTKLQRSLDTTTFITRCICNAWWCGLILCDVMFFLTREKSHQVAYVHAFNNTYIFYASSRRVHIML